MTVTTVVTVVTMMRTTIIIVVVVVIDVIIMKQTNVKLISNVLNMIEQREAGKNAQGQRFSTAVP